MAAGSVFLVVAILGFVLGCAPGGTRVARTTDHDGVVSGSVAFRERMALPPDAIVTVQLSDVSRQDGAAPVIAETTILPEGRHVPLPFELRYDPSRIQPTHTYALRATISSAGRMTFTTNSPYPVITQGNPTRVDLRLVGVDGEARGTTGGITTRAAAIRSSLAGYRAVEGASSAADNAGKWTAYFDEGSLKFIDERSNQGDYGSAENEYYFEKGALFAYVSRGVRAVTDPARPAGKEPVTLSLGFDESGGLAERSKTVSGRSAPVESSDVSGAKARAAFLAGEAASAAAAPVVPTAPAFRAPVSRSGRMVLAAGKLRFIACGEGGDGIPIEDLPEGDGKALVRELGAGEKRISVMIRLDRDRLQEIRYAGAEGPRCDRLPPEGEVEARGTEPFWMIRVESTRARVHTPEEPDGVAYRDGKWSRADGVRWLYEARRARPDRVEQLTLELTEVRCVDTMSGARYPFRAVLTRDGNRTEGCALEGRRARATMSER